MDVAFRALTEADLPLLHEWLRREHVRRWWRDTDTLAETVARYLPPLRGEEPTDHYAILVDGRPAGMVETYLTVDHPEWMPSSRRGRASPASTS